jgi:hypothetical protein
MWHVVHVLPSQWGTWTTLYQSERLAKIIHHDITEKFVWEVLLKIMLVLGLKFLSCILSTLPGCLFLIDTARRHLAWYFSYTHSNDEPNYGRWQRWVFRPVRLPSRALLNGLYFSIDGHTHKNKYDRDSTCLPEPWQGPAIYKKFLLWVTIWCGVLWECEDGQIAWNIKNEPLLQYLLPKKWLPHSSPPLHPCNKPTTYGWMSVSIPSHLGQHTCSHLTKRKEPGPFCIQFFLISTFDVAHHRLTRQHALITKAFGGLLHAPVKLTDQDIVLESASGAGKQTSTYPGTES